MLPRFFILPWWLVVLTLSATAVVSVPNTEGEEPSQPLESFQENQEVGDAQAEEAVSQESALVQKLKARLAALGEREQRLQKKQERLQGLQRDLEKLAARQTQEAQRLSEWEGQLEALRKRLAAQDSSLAHLIKVYEAMDPEEAALRIEKMKEGLALDILARIKGKKAAGVLASVKPEKAARLSEGLRHYRQVKGNKK